jgi:hypothetical protein
VAHITRANPTLRALREILATSPTKDIELRRVIELRDKLREHLDAAAEACAAAAVFCGHANIAAAVRWARPCFQSQSRMAARWTKAR